MSKIFIISGPSGAGEDSVINGLKKIMPLEVVTTTTTREMRLGESEGNPYYFVSPEEFQEKIAEDQLYEYAQEYNDLYYGVTKEEIERVKDLDEIGIWKIEYKGVMTAKEKMPGIVAILISAPLDILEKRIRNRDNVSDEFVKERLEYTKEWLKHRDIYDYEVKNTEGELDKTIEKVANIIKNNQ